MFYSLSILLLLANSLSKALRLLFIFVRVRKGHAPFETKRYAFPGSLRSQLRCFSAIKCSTSLLGRPLTTIYKSRYTRFFPEEKETTRQGLPVLQAFISPYFLAFFSRLQAGFSEESFAHVGVERQTNIHTYIHTYTHTHFSENNFSKPDGQ